jgi:hypothetical protein
MWAETGKTLRKAAECGAGGEYDTGRFSIFVGR